jgi:epoxyqueuosine reductase
MQNITSEIKRIGLDIGFDKIGMTPAIQPPKSDYLKLWLKNDFHGTMNWMATYQDKRRDIQKFFPGAKSVICVGHNYFSPFYHTRRKDKAKISRYACGEDYHKIMKKKLRTFLERLKKLDHEIDGQLCVDTAPIMEKLWAEQAGLGWQGKNTNLITRDYGSWLFLGELIINKELVYDQPMGDFCGSCQACLKACPTEALIEPYVLDARKCISYLTIEYWDRPIPAVLKKKMNSWVFGCDICQDVCPWNKFSKKTYEKRYIPKDNAIEFDLNELNDLDEPAYKQKFKKSPVLRPGYTNFLRNVDAVKKKP